jgi:hypothetical protein
MDLHGFAWFFLTLLLTEVHHRLRDKYPFLA